MLQTIIEMNRNIEDISDRKSGIKLDAYLKKSKFGTIKLFYNPIYTVNNTEEERSALFFIQFIPKLNIIKNILSQNPNDVELQKQLD